MRDASGGSGPCRFPWNRVHTCSELSDKREIEVGRARNQGHLTHPNVSVEAIFVDITCDRISAQQLCLLQGRCCTACTNVKIHVLYLFYSDPSSLPHQIHALRYRLIQSSRCDAPPPLNQTSKQCANKNISDDADQMPTLHHRCSTPEAMCGYCCRASLFGSSAVCKGGRCSL